MTPDPLYTVTFPDGTSVSAGVDGGKIVVDGNNVAAVESLTNSVQSDLDYTIPEGIVARMDTVWALPNTMREVLGDVDVRLVRGTPTPIPESYNEPPPEESAGEPTSPGYHSSMTTLADVRAMRDRQPSADPMAAARARVRERLSSARTGDTADPPAPDGQP